jgi:hypothetical protein
LSSRVDAVSRIEIVDPPAWAGPASRVLQAAWQPPCLHYTQDYLRWQFRFPGDSKAVGSAAFDGAEPVGFLAAVPRWVLCGSVRIAAHLLSFLAVRPGWRGPQPGRREPISVGLCRTLFGALRRTGKPVLTYVQSSSVAALFLRSFEEVGFQSLHLGSYRTYGTASKPGPTSLAARVEDAAEDEFREVIEGCHDGRTLWSDPGRDQLRHYREDPRGRALAIVRDASGGATGAAMVVLSEVVSPKGVELIPMLDSIFLPRPSAEALIALVRFAGERWAGRASSPIVTAPNLRGIDAVVLRAAGLRAMSSVFQGYLFAPTFDALPDRIEGTNLEIV